MELGVRDGTLPVGLFLFFVCCCTQNSLALLILTVLCFPTSYHHLPSPSRTCNTPRGLSEYIMWFFGIIPGGFCCFDKCVWFVLCFLLPWKNLLSVDICSTFRVIVSFSVFHTLLWHRATVFGLLQYIYHMPRVSPYAHPRLHFPCCLSTDAWSSQIGWHVDFEFFREVHMKSFSFSKFCFRLGNSRCTAHAHVVVPNSRAFKSVS